jgi:hypothetical protein
MEQMEEIHRAGATSKSASLPADVMMKVSIVVSEEPMKMQDQSEMVQQLTERGRRARSRSYFRPPSMIHDTFRR